MNILDKIDKEQMRFDHPHFQGGDTIRVHIRIVEGDKERVQIFQGVVLKRKRGNMNATFTVRKISNGVGVERAFQTYSPLVDSVEVKRRGDVRRAKLYYLRGLTGKAARIKEKLG